MPWGTFLTYVGQATIVVLLVLLLAAVVTALVQTVRRPRGITPAHPDHEVHERLLDGER